MIVFGAVAAGAAIIACVLALATTATFDTRIAHPDREALGVALPGWTIARWEAARAALVCVAFAVHTPALIVIAVGIGPSVALRYWADERRARGAAGAVGVLQATHAALRSGLGLAAALRSALEPASAGTRAPFERALRSFELNGGMADAFDASRAVSHDARLTVALDALALVAREELPATRAAVVIGSVADRLAFEQRVREEVDARASGVRWQIALLALLVPGLALYLVVTMPGLASTLASPLGMRLLLPAAAILEIAGVVASRVIVRDLAL